MSEYKLIAFDLDGTLTQHKSKLDEKNTSVLLRLASDYHLVIVGAGSCERIWKQMNEFEIDIIGNYGMQFSHVKNKNLILDVNESYTADRNFFINTIAELRNHFGYTKYLGDSVEFHPSGAVTFPLLGTGANLPEKLSFDPDGKKRSMMYPEVSKKFKNYNCFIGGTSSFDIVDKQYDKYQALMKYAKAKNILPDDILFIGDDFKKGGNDEHVLLGGIDCICVRNYCELETLLISKEILKK